METDILVRTTTTDGSDLRYMTAGRVTDAVAAEREQMAATSDENPFQNPPINDRSTGIRYSPLCWKVSYFRVSICTTHCMNKRLYYSYVKHINIQ